MSREDKQVSAWSRRRAAVRAEAEADVKHATQEARAKVRADVQAQQVDKSDADILRELSLQDPDQMAAGDDFSAFLRDEVPQRLQRRALKALWRSNPVLACVDGLLDYGDDFKAEGLGGEAIRTAYQVGKGMLAHVDEMHKQAADANDEVTPEDETATTESVTPPVVAPVFTPVIPTARAAPEPTMALVADEVTQEPMEYAEQPLIPPRMRFEFEDTA